MKRAVAAFALILLLAGCSPQSDSSGARPSPKRACVVVKGDAELRSGSTETAQGHMSYQEWIANPEAQMANGAIEQAIEVFLGIQPPEGKGGPNIALERGHIGSTLDHHAQEKVVVVDPRLVDMKQMEMALEEAVRTVPGADPGKPALELRVQAGCFSAEELLEAERVIDARDWHPRASSTCYGVGLDPTDSTFSFSMDEKGREVAKALEKKLGARVKFSFEGCPQRLPLRSPAPRS